MKYFLMDEARLNKIQNRLIGAFISTSELKALTEDLVELECVNPEATLGYRDWSECPVEVPDPTWTVEWEGRTISMQAPSARAAIDRFMEEIPDSATGGNFTIMRREGT